MTPLAKQQALHEAESPDPGPEIYHSHFSRRKQFLGLLLDEFLYFILTIFFVGCIYATLKAFRTRTIIGPVGKRVFNALVTGLSMILGISIASSFKDLAIDMRWWILSRKRRPISEVDAILSSHSLTQAAQAAVAMLGLTYSLNPAVDPARSVLGSTSFSNMSETYSRVLDGDSTPSNQLAAHTMFLQFLPIPLNGEDQNTTSESGAYLSPVGYTQWFFDAENHYERIFQETSATDTTSAFFWSNRSIVTTSTCSVCLVLNNTNGTQDTFQYQKDNGTINQTLKI
ncbi:hypothetical protein BDZ45DRAFT_751073 [Acephala macrosclerotiorum]|nr:hypothetical protein BDZ45DRAFT_751073 [Acephala macrosclerotiorum]